jgi:superfamily I DNA and/or RNA helicase
VNGLCDDGHVVLRQITYVSDIIRAIRERVSPIPSIYVITPFRDIAKAARAELAKVGLTNDDTCTVHTFQGKQADIVFMILGLDEKNAGAASFAARMPNLLNVAITHAKHRCYIVGAASVWGSSGYFGFAREKLGQSAPEPFLAEIHAAQGVEA